MKELPAIQAKNEGGQKERERIADNDDELPVSDVPEFEDADAAARDGGGLKQKVTAAVQNCHILWTNDNSKYIVSSKDLEIPKNTQIGGVGGGSFQPAANQEDGLVSYEFPDGVRDLDLA